VLQTHTASPQWSTYGRSFALLIRLKQLELRVDGPVVARVAGDDGVAAFARADDHRDVDDIAHPDLARDNAHESGPKIVQRHDLSYHAPGR
jgi:hypothetical protein